MKPILRDFIRIGGRHAYPLPCCALLQTDGSYKTRKGAVAAILTTPDNRTVYRNTHPIVASNSTEAEWASIANGIRFALEKEQFLLAVENDNLSVIAALTGYGTLNHSYARYYKSQITKLTAQTLWTGVRWIPRELNRADDLFLR